MYNSMLLKEFKHLIIDILASTISSESFYNSVVLGLAFMDELSKYFDRIRLNLKGVNLSISCAVINKRNIVPGIAEGWF